MNRGLLLLADTKAHTKAHTKDHTKKSLCTKVDTIYVSKILYIKDTMCVFNISTNYTCERIGFVLAAFNVGFNVSLLVSES